MKSLIKTSGVSVLLLALAGCADFKLPELPKLPTLEPAPQKPLPVVSDSLDEICKTIKENDMRAEEIYTGKMLSVTANFLYVKEAQYILQNKINHEYKVVPNYELTLEIKKAAFQIVSIFAQTKDKSNKQNVLSLSAGQKTTVTGKISGLSIPCSIHMVDIEFSVTKQ